MINEDRFWEGAIAEAVRNEPAPDVTAKVLAELADKQPETPRQRGRVRFLRWGLELAGAAVVVVAIGLATGIIRLPGGEQNVPLPPGQFAAAPGTEYEHNDDVLELTHGWLLVTTGAPTVTCDGSELSKVDGRVLIHAGSMPPGGRPESVENWLKANNVETDMVNNIKHWVKGVGLAALVLSGTAMLDGQEIKAPEPQPQSTAEWHVVRSVMDIDNLPKGVKYVNADGLDAAHLDFLVTVESLEGISARNCDGLRADHLTGLKALPKLAWLDLRGAAWAQVPEFDGLKDLPELKRLGVDLIPAAFRNESGGSPVYAHGRLANSASYSTEEYVGEESFASTLSTLKALSDRGVEIDLGQWRPVDQEQLTGLLSDLPTLSGMILKSPTVAMMKALSSHEKLTSVELVDYDAGQIGLAYLARKSVLNELTVSAYGISLEEAYQISRMNLRFLRIDARLSDSLERTFEALAGMKQLRELELVGLKLNEQGLPAFSKFKDREPLDRLQIGLDLFVDYAYGMELMVAQQIPTRKLEVIADELYIWTLDDIDEHLRNGEAAKHLTTLRLELREGVFDVDQMDPAYAEPYKSYPNLKRIEIRRGGFDEPAMEDQFVRWLKTNLPNVEVVLTP